jgi:beta-fructofuranosidase
MYASHGFLRSDIGDVDVVYHDGVYHLFHLVLPNHDFIAHAVSTDGMIWRRVRNALFVDEPGSWDDDMLWTMHVVPDLEKHGAWRMFYTGLSRAEFGRIQRVGLARSDDLYHWTRCSNGSYPIQIDGTYYESRVDEGRNWVSFRDPFFYRDPVSGDRLLLCSARVKDGPVIRRGCVGLARETSPDHFVFTAPLHRPGLYDDVEVPNLFRLNGRYYLLGSVREDTKIHYWHADTLYGPYENFYDNVLLPSGNYAARVCQVGDKTLLFNFFSRKETVNGREIIARLLPPPKEISTNADGRLFLRSFGEFDRLTTGKITLTRAAAFDVLFGNPHASAEDTDRGLHLACPSGCEAFLLPGEHEDFRLRARLRLAGQGKCGLVLRTTREGDGYYLALDLVKGYVELRHWGASPRPQFEHAFRFEILQSGAFIINSTRQDWEIEVVTHGVYLELSINGQITLSLVDDGFQRGRVGFYVESAKLLLTDVTLEGLHRPAEEHEAVYTATRPAEMSVPVPDPHAG